MLNITNHAIDRITDRLSSLITLQEVTAVTDHVSDNGSETWVILKKLDRSISFNDGGRVINGDTIVGVSRNGNVTTVMLTRRGQVAKRAHIGG